MASLCPLSPWAPESLGAGSSSGSGPPRPERRPHQPRGFAKHPPRLWPRERPSGPWSAAALPPTSEVPSPPGLRGTVVSGKSGATPVFERKVPSSWRQPPPPLRLALLMALGSDSHASFQASKPQPFPGLALPRPRLALGQANGEPGQQRRKASYCVTRLCLRAGCAWEQCASTGDGVCGWGTGVPGWFGSHCVQSKAWPLGGRPGVEGQSRDHLHRAHGWNHTGCGQVGAAATPRTPDPGWSPGPFCSRSGNRVGEAAKWEACLGSPCPLPSPIPHVSGALL